MSMAVLALYLNVANVLDLQTTLDGLKRGLKEANPIANYVLQTSGTQGLAEFKIAPVIALTTIALIAGDKHFTKLITAMTIVFSIAAMNNVFLIALKGKR
jgi:hypothetical protein